jgi:hypothetical protein
MIQRNILNTIVFSSKVGLEVNGAANYVSGVHVWFPENQALAFLQQGVMAFSINEGQNRFQGCYIDGDAMESRRLVLRRTASL